MVNSYRPPAPRLQFGTYDPWAAWKRGNDPYAPQFQPPAGATVQGTIGADPGASPYTSPYAASWGPWQSAGGGPFTAYARTATPDPQGRLPGQEGYGTSQPGTGRTAGVVNPDGSVTTSIGTPDLTPRAPHLTNTQARTGTQQPNQPPTPMAEFTPPSALATGAGQAAVGAGKPAWARFTGGNDGSSYAALNDFDPWGNWGQYGPNQARNPVVHTNGTRPESDIDRVYRWTNDILRTQYGVAGGEAADPALRRAIFLANVERLKSEYAQRGLDWNTSAFADMDRGVQARTGQPPAAPGAQPGAGGGTAPAAGGGGGGGGAGGPGTTAPGGGGGGIFPSEVELELARQSPQYAIAAYRKARGGGRDKSAVGEFRENTMGQAVRAFLTMLGAGSGATGDPVAAANAGMGEMMRALAAGSGVGGMLRRQAGQMLDQDLSGFDDTQLLNMFGAAQGAGTFGLGPFAQYALDNAYGDLEHTAQQNALGGGTTAALANPAARKAFMDALARYLAVR